MAPKDKEAIKLTAGKEEERKKESSDKKETPEDTLSEEDRELKERLETCVATVANKEREASVTPPIQLKALEVIVNELRTATSSMTSVPKPLKFLRPHFTVLKDTYNSLKTENIDKDTLELRARLADVLAVLAMTMGNREERESLHLKLNGIKDYETLAEKGMKTDAKENIVTWGHEFIRSLAGEIGEEYNQRIIDGADPDVDEPFLDLLKMVDIIVPFHVTHNAEAEAIDLLIEVQRLKKLLEFDAIDENNYHRICLYLIKTADYMADPEDLTVGSCHFSNSFLNGLDHTLTHSLILCRKCLKQHAKFTRNKTSTLMLSACFFVWIAWKKFHNSSVIAKIPYSVAKCVLFWDVIV